MNNKNENNTKKLGLFQRIRESVMNRTVSLGLYVSVVSIIFIAVVVFINLIVTKADISGDLSNNKVYSITDETVKYLDKLKDDIVIYYISSPDEMSDNIYELVKKYDDESKHIKVKVKDPVVYPTFVDQYTDEEVSSNSVIVVNKKDTSKYKYIAYSSLVQTEVDYSTYQSQITGIDVEGQVTSAINYVTSEAAMKMYFLTGHEESENFDSGITDLISKQNIQSDTINLQTSKDIPKDCDLLAIVSPKRDLDESEVKKIEKYFKSGKPIVICMGYTEKNLENLNKLLKNYGLVNHQGLVVEKSIDNRAGQGYTTLFPDLSGHDITGSFGNVYACMPLATGMKQAEVMPKGITVEPILESSSKSYAVTDMSLSIETVNKNNSEKGPFNIGSAISLNNGSEISKMVVYASGSAFDSSEDIATSQYINAEMMLSTINWLCDIDASTTVSIPVKEIANTQLTVDGSQQLIWTLLMVIVIPLMILMVGFVVWLRRRRR